MLLIVCVFTSLSDDVNQRHDPSQHIGLNLHNHILMV